MCGIFGYAGARPAAPLIFEGLSRLEYRGYDSAGIAVQQDSRFIIKKVEGKLKGLKPHLKTMGKSTTGIGHTRWATHGKPSVANAHPHKVDRVVLVHNGIIENYQTLKKQLLKLGCRFKSETDTEVVSHLLDQAFKRTGNFKEAFFATLIQLEGAYSFVAMSTAEPGRLYAAKKGSPLVIGLGKKENVVASDIPAVLPHTKKVIFPENGDICLIEPQGVKFFNLQGKELKKPVRTISWSAEMAEKGGYKHFMLKEIMEQPSAAQDTLAGRQLSRDGLMELEELAPLFRRQTQYNRVHLVACGTSWHAALCGKYYIEAIAKIPVNVDTASEFRYREPFLDKKTLLIVISQSGETADTLACVEEARRSGSKVIAVCNAVDASIPRASHATLYTHAGPEIGVASTKAFTTQLIVLLQMALYMGQETGRRNKTYIRHALSALKRLPERMESVLKQNDDIQKLAERYCTARDVYFIARGVHFPIALEGALKLKEISYIHAEGYSAGEMKHGPIALIEPGTPVIALAPDDRVCIKMMANIEEVQARGASVIALVTHGDRRFDRLSDAVIPMPAMLWYITPIVASIPLQLLAYHIADLKGADIDQPRNLAKSVTVE